MRPSNICARESSVLSVLFLVSPSHDSLRRLGVLLLLFPLFFVLRESSADEVKTVQTLPATPAQEAFNKGELALKSNKLADAQASFQKSMQLDPQLVSPLLGMAEINILKGNVAGADEYLRKATVLSPNDPNVWVTRGHYLFFRKNNAEAEKAFKTAITLNPKLERPYYELGDLYLLGLRRPGDAIAAYQSALAIKPDDSRVHYTLANALAELGRLDETQVQLEEAARLDPKNASLQSSIGDFNLKRGKFDLAQQAFAKAIAIDPHFVAARIGEGDVFVARRDFDHALSSYDAALQTSPKSSAVLIKIGVLQELKGHWNEAEQTYRKALAIDSKLVLAANNLAWILNEHQKKPAEALKWAIAAATLSPKDSNILDTLGWVQRANGDQTSALATLKHANKLAPENPQILYHLGAIYQETKQPQLAIQSLSKALSLSKNFDGAADAQARLDVLHRVS
jgi:tetratricopeptide (TPR) repeat protein